MGVYIHFQAMPDDSRLARMLRTERLLCAMYCEIIHSPIGPWDTDRLSQEDLDEKLGDIAHNQTFGSHKAARQAYDDLRAELERAEREYPGLRRRAAYFKLMDFDVDLGHALVAAGRPDGERLAESLTWRAKSFAPQGFGGRNVTLQHVPPSMIVDAAGYLPNVNPKTFEWRAEDWTAFQRVFIEAAARREGIVIACG